MKIPNQYASHGLRGNGLRKEHARDSSQRQRTAGRPIMRLLGRRTALSHKSIHRTSAACLCPGRFRTAPPHRSKVAVAVDGVIYFSTPKRHV